MSSSEVQLAVYDLSRGMARSMSQAILGQRIDGIWHTGVVVFGKEYYFGGGIQVMPWGTFAVMNSMQPTEVQTLGRTSKSQFELEEYLRGISHQFTQATYDLINHNCNNFSDTVCKFLLGHGIPSYIVDLPRIVFSTPGGAMLRPMIESMQNNVRQQQGFGLDPFSQPPQGGMQAAPAQSLESALADSMVSLVDNQARQARAQSTVKLAELEENAWVSTDATSVGALANKILNLAAPNDVAGSALSAEEKERLKTIAGALPSAGGPSFSVEDYALLEGILTRHPEAHLACLFLLRLMFLHDKRTNFHEIALIRQLVQRLLAKEGAEALSQPGGVTGFATIPAHVMALCAMGNLLSHQNGLALLGDQPSAGEEAAAEKADASNRPQDSNGPEATQLLNDIVDVVLAGLNHGRAEVRQMSATLGYNLTLACTKDGQLSGPWKSSASPDGAGAVELNGQALQLLCGCLEGLHEEKDDLVCKRRLAISCRILRAFGAAAIQLVKDLGMDGALYMMKSRPLPESSMALVNEILSYM